MPHLPLALRPTAESETRRLTGCFTGFPTSRDILLWYETEEGELEGELEGECSSPKRPTKAVKWMGID